MRAPQMHTEVAFQKKSSRFSTFTAALLMLFGGDAVVGTAMAAAPVETIGTTYRFDIPAQKLNDALQALALTSRHKLLCSAELVEGKNSSALRGEFTAEQAVRQLLAGTGLVYEVSDGLVLIRRAGEGFTWNTINNSTLDVRGEGGKGWDSSCGPGMGNSGNGGRESDGAGAINPNCNHMKIAQNSGGGNSSGKTTENTSKTDEEDKNTNNRENLQEIVVTAQKREERLQDVPMSIAVVSSQDIERRGLIGMEDYLRGIPGVNQIDKGPINNSIIIRGITVAPEFEGLRPTVASYFDETPITAAGGSSAGGIDVRPVDIERIEVLRGPQGTTFGDSSLGGAMRIIPVKPRLDAFGAKFVAGYSQTSRLGGDNNMVQGVVNVPLVNDRFAVRAVGYRYDESGYYRNIAGIDPATLANAQTWGLGNLVAGYVQDDVGRILSTGGRLSALWQATDKLDLSLTFLTQKIEEDGTPEAGGQSPGATLGEYEQTRTPIVPIGRRRGAAGNIADTDIDLVNLVLNDDLGWSTFTAVASWVNGGSQYATSSNIVFPASITNDADFRTFTAETRLASRLHGRFQFLGGLYYQNTDDDSSSVGDWLGFPALPPIFLFNPLLSVSNSQNIKQRAVFGELSYALTDTLTATAGGRYFKYKTSSHPLSEGSLFQNPLGTGTPDDRKGDDDGTKFKVNLSYKPVQDSQIYASWAQGFRLGPPDGSGVSPGLCDLNNDGLIDGTNVTLASTKHLDSDYTDNYELGGKFVLFNRRMAINTAVYHIDWIGLPAGVPVNCNGTATIFTANAGSATSDGVEFQASLLVLDGLRVDFGGGYTKAELSKTTNVGPRGARLPGTPRVSANLAAQYDFKVAGYNSFVRADSFYTGKFYRAFVEAPGWDAGDYVKIDVRAGIAIRNVSAELFVRNLTNEDAFTWRTFNAGPTNPVAGYRLRPRTIGIQLGYSFE